MREKAILVTSFISAEFKYDDKRRKELTRDDKDISVVGRPADGFQKVTSHVVNYVFKRNQVVSMNFVYGICYRTVNGDLRKGAIGKG